MSSKSRLGLTLFRDWFFDRLIFVLTSGEWEVRIKDFGNSKIKKERELFGLADPHEDKDGGIIFLDIKRGMPRILVHELGHAVLGDILDAEATQRFKTKNQINRWTEDQVLIFERYFYKGLSTDQKKTLKTFIDRAKIDFRHNW